MAVPLQLSALNKEGMQWDSLDALYNLPINLQLPYNKITCSFISHSCIWESRIQYGTVIFLKESIIPGVKNV